MNRKTRKHRIAAVFLSLLIAMQNASMEAFADMIGSFGDTGKRAASDSAAGDAQPAFDHLYFEDDLMRSMDFSNKRLLVGANDKSVFTPDTNVISGYNGVYLLGFDTEFETMSAYTYYYGIADLVEPDITLFVADDSYVGGTSAEDTDALSWLRALKNNEDAAELPHYDVAIIDTGVAYDEADSVSVIGEDAEDDNGHGTHMLNTVRSVSPELSVLSVKAFDDSGAGTLSSVYAAMVYAIGAGADVIDLPFAAESVTGSKLIERTAVMAQDLGLAVVGAAGNDSADVSGYIPGNIAGVYIAGVCDKAGERLSESNYGSNVFCNVAAGETSEAAAKLSAVIAAYGSENVFSQNVKGIVFANDFDEYELSEEPDLETMSAALDDSAPVVFSGEEILPVADELEEGGEDDTGSTDQPSVGSVTIDHVSIKWLTESEIEGEDEDRSSLELNPVDKKLTNQQFQIDFALSGQGSYEPGTIKITIPAYIWYNRDGERYGNLTLSVPEHPGKGTDFEWEDMGDYVVITNIKKIAAASRMMLQGTYRNMLATEMKDGSESDDLQVTVTVQTPDGTASLTSNTINASINTMVEVTNVEKSAYNYIKGKYDVFWNGAPDEMPKELLGKKGEANYIDEEEYVFVRWYVAGAAGGSQKFKLYLEDTINSDDARDFGGKMLGVSHCIDGEKSTTNSGVYYSMSSDRKNVSALLYDGYDTLSKTAYVWTAYLRSEFSEDKEDELHNNVTIKAAGYDDKVASDELEKDAIATTKYPTEYTFTKVWANDEDALEHRPHKLQVNIYRTDDDGTVLWRYVTIDDGEEYLVTEGENAGNAWEYKWNDEGVLSNFTVSERLLNHEGRYSEKYNDRSHYIHWFYELTDREFDEDENHWTFTNTYFERWEDDTLSVVKKENKDAKFTESRRVSKLDGLSLNKLLRGETVTVPYTIGATISEARRYMDGITGHIFMLEDSSYGFSGTQWGDTDSIAIGSVTIGSVNAYDYDLGKGEEITDSDGYANTVYPVTPSEAPETTLWGNFKTKAADEDNWVALATFKSGDWKKIGTNSKFDIVTDENGMDKAVFDGGVYGIRLTTESDAAFVSYYCETELLIKPSDYIIGLINKSIDDRETAVSSDETYFIYSLVNYADIYTQYTGENENVSKNLTHEGRDSCTSYLHGRPFKVAADLVKTFDIPEDEKNTANDTINKRVKLHSTLKLTQQSNIPESERTDYENALVEGNIVNTASGIFYDLLPHGVDPDLSSFKLTAGIKTINPMMIKNYKGTNRTLLIVQAEFEDNISYSSPYKVNEADPSQNQPGRYLENTAVYNKENGYPIEGWQNNHTLEFDAYITYDDIFNHEGKLKSLVNVASFEADENEIGNLSNWKGEPDSPKGEYDAEEGKWSQNNKLSDTLKGYVGSTLIDEFDNMTGLDSGRTDPSFVYAAAELIPTEIDRHLKLDLEKTVQSSGSGTWSSGLKSDDKDPVNVSEGGLYTYRLTATTDSDTNLSDIVFLDFIEYYTPSTVSGDVEGVGDNKWNGSLVSVDLTLPKELGIAPVVYYCTTGLTPKYVSEIEELYESGGTTLAEFLDGEVAANRWTKDPEDMSSVTAVAVDLRKTTDEKDFILTENRHMTIYLEMVAPYENVEQPYYFINMNGEPTDGTEPDENAHAYNKSNVICKKANTNEQKFEPTKLISGYTKVGISARSVDVEKKWEDDEDRDGIRPDSVEVTLHNENDKKDVQTITLDSKNDWKGTFNRVPVYDDDGNPIIYSYKEKFAGSDKYTQSVGRITVDGKLTICITNTHDPERITIPVTKHWNDGDNEANARPSSIKVRLYADDDTEPTATITIRPDNDGNWYGEFKELYKYKHVKKLISYRVEEEAIEDYRFDGEEYSYEQDPDGAEGKITKSVTIRNKYYPYGDLKIGKTVKNATAVSEKQEFEFKLMIWAENDDETITVSEKYAYEIYDSSKPEEDNPINAFDKTNGIGNGDVFTLKGGQYLVIKDIETHIDSNGKRWNLMYKVTEAEDISGFELTGETDSSGRIISWTPADAEFINTYSTNGSAKIEAFKELNGRTLRQYQFEFGLYDANTGELVRTAYNGSDGKVTFGTIGYTGADHGKVYKYYMTETTPKGYTNGEFADGYQYDVSRFYVEVSVTDNGDGTMRCVMIYFDKDGNVIGVVGLDENDPEDEAYKDFVKRFPDFDFADAATPEFDNNYKASGEITLKAWKSIDGGELDSDTKFDFDLYRYDESDKTFAHVDHQQNQETVITFAPQSFNEDNAGKTYWFFAREIDKNDNIYIYDERIIGYRVTVVDNGDGTLSFDQSAYDMTELFTACSVCEGESAGCETCAGFGFEVKGSLTTPEDTYLPLFINGMEDGSLSICKKVTGADAEAQEQDFTFTVRLIGDKVDDIGSKIAYTITEEGKPDIPGKEATVTDGKFTITLKAGQTAKFDKNIPAGTSYQVLESPVKEWVQDDQKNVAGVITPKSDAEAEFTNKYVPGAVSAVIVGSKYFDNKLTDPKRDGETFKFELWKNGERIETATATAGGLIQFSALTYTTYGTHEYEVREVIGNNSDIIYDKVARKVIVKVDVNAVTKELEATITYYDAEGKAVDEMRFDNISAPGSMTIDKSFLGVRNEENDPMFAFKMTFTNTNGMPLTGESVGYIVKGADGKYYDGSKEHKELKNQPETFKPANLPEETTEIVSAVVATYNAEPRAAVEETIIENGSGTWGTVNWKIVTTGETVKTTTNGDKPEHILVLEPSSGVEGTLALTDRTHTAPWRDAKFKDLITSIEIRNGKVCTNIEGNPSLFQGLTNLVEADLRGLDLSKTTAGLNSMFANCSNLQTVNLDGVRVHEATNVSYMFNNCYELTTIIGIEDLLAERSGNTPTNIEEMFSYCKKLSSLDLSKWNTKGITRLSSMFNYCESLTVINGIEDFKTDDVTAAYYMFQYCGIAGDIDLSGWNVSNIQSVDNFFSNAKNLVNVDLSGWNLASITIQNATGSASMFYNCTSLESVDVSGWTIGGEKFSSLYSMFYNCGNLKSINMSNWTVLPTSNLSVAGSLFYNCSSLTTLDVSGWSGISEGQFTNCYSVFSNCKSLKELTIDSTFYTAFKTETTLATLKPGYINNVLSPSYTGNWVALDEVGNYDKTAVGIDSLALATALNSGNVAKTTYVWQRATYSIQFNKGEGNGVTVDGSMSADRALVDEQYVIENKFKSNGYIFAGWSDGKGNVFGTNYIPAGTYSADESVTLTALWEPEDSDDLITINFTYHLQAIDDKKDYSDTGTYPYKVSNKATTAVIDPEAILPEILAGFKPKDENHRSVTIKIENGIPQYTENDLNFYYDRMRYTVKFDGNGAPGEMADKEMVVNVPDVLGNTFVWNGHAFLNWKTEDGREFEAFSPESIEGMEDGDTITLYAQWFEVKESPIKSTEGVVTVYCMAGETIIFTSLPAGTQYTIEEIEIPEGWKLKDKSGDTGKIKPNEISSASFINLYSALGSAGVEAHKRLEGATLQPSEFGFVLNTNPHGAADTYTETVGPNKQNADGDYEDEFKYDGAIGLNVKIDAEAIDANADSVIYVYDTAGELLETIDPADGESTIEVEDGDSVKIVAHNATYEAEITAKYAVLDTVYNGILDSNEQLHETTDTGKDIVKDNPWYGTGIVSFEPLDYTAKGEYVYYIWEIVDEDDKSIDYDRHGVMVKVTMEDNNSGRLVPTVEYFDMDGNPLDGAEFCNKMMPGTLTISKVLQNALGNVVDKKFAFKITLTDANDIPISGEYEIEVKPEVSGTGDEKLTTDENGVGYLYIKGGQSFTVIGLPDGAKYTIEEVELGEHFRQVDSEGDNGAITAIAPTEATFTNIYENAEGEVTLVVNKNFIGGDLSENTFRFSLFQGNDIIKQADTNENGNAYFTLDFALEDLKELPATFTYTIREDLPDPNGSTLPDIRYDEHEVIVTVTVSNDEEGNLIFDTSYEYKNTDDDSGEYEANTFNNIGLFDLEISKKVTGTFIDRGREFDFTLVLSNDKYGLTDGITYTKGDESGAVELDEEGRYSIKLRHGEAITLHRLPYGTAYTITEDGVDESEYIVTATVSGDEYSTNANGIISGTITQKVSVAYVNEYLIDQSPALSAAGGVGTRDIYIAGTMLLLSAATLEMKRRRRKKQRQVSS